MAMKAIIDLVLLGVLIICVWSGYKKGIIMGVGGILCIIIAVYGANLLANSFSFDVVPALKPFANGYTETMMNGSDSAVMKRMGWDGTTYRVEDLVRQSANETLMTAKRAILRPAGDILLVHAYSAEQFKF